MHGIIDYVFSGIQLFAPALLGLNTNTTQTYQALGAGFLLTNALTNTPVGLKKVISFKAHQKTDATILLGLSLLTFTRMIRKDEKALSFHLSFLGTAIAHYALTGYDNITG